MATAKYTLKEVKREDKRLVREFLELPKRIYKNTPEWVCPFDSSIEAVFDPAKNKLFQDGEAIRWVAYNAEGECVGRIAAFYDKTHAYSYEQPTGGCGFFEAIDDQELANFMPVRSIIFFRISILLSCTNTAPPDVSSFV